MGAEAGHVPVLNHEVLDRLAPRGRRVLVDCTVGLGGHAESLLEAADPNAVLLGIDRDEETLLAARRRLERFGKRVRLFAEDFCRLPEILAEADEAAAELILADLGVCSRQLDTPERGFSFIDEGPLDMRLDRSTEPTAEQIVNETAEADLADLIYRYGEERYSRRIARRIVEARRRERIRTTTRLAEIVERAVPAPARRKRRGVHPATRTFQALRIAVNDELGSLDALLAALPGSLAVGGRAGVISFHSLEDRRVKHAFADWAGSGGAKVLTKKPVRPSAEEVSRNPRSRSAKFRAIERVNE